MIRNIGHELILCKTCIKGYDSHNEKKFCPYAPKTFCADYIPNIDKDDGSDCPFPPRDGYESQHLGGLQRSKENTQ